jgi:pyruvate/2-oxoglutarate dehydrogenase complex dihydrolipoamide dehydrogenase (E3) component
LISENGFDEVHPDLLKNIKECEVNSKDKYVDVKLESGDTIRAEVFLDTMGRQGNTDRLNFGLGRTTDP